VNDAIEVDSLRANSSVHLRLPFEHFASIGLAELSEVAANLRRVERKYIVTPENAAMLLHDGSLAAMRALEIDGQRSVRYQSTYFDTADLASFRSTAARHRRRFKVRCRRYSTGDAVTLEVKQLSTGEHTEKLRRVRATAETVFDANEVAWIDELIDRPGFAAGANPVIETSYHRSTLFDPVSASRMTFDSAVQAIQTNQPPSCAQDRARPVGQWGDLVVVETKTTGVASPVDRLLWQLGIRPVRMSKFAIGMVLTYPGLPSNQWNRVLRTHFNWTPK
jgi:VTC domain